MTHSGGKPHAVGDQGQRYEVRFQDESGAERVLGWSTKLVGAKSYAEAIEQHPTWHSPRIIDRQPDLPKEEP